MLKKKDSHNVTKSPGKKQSTSSVTFNMTFNVTPNEHLLVPCFRDKDQRTNSQCSFSVVYSNVFVRWCLLSVYSTRMVT